jgi:hypothetical protein
MLLGCIIKSICETVIIGDNPIGRAVRYFSSSGRLKRWREQEEKLRELKMGKYEADEVGMKQIGMAIEMEYQAREAARGLDKK